MQTQDDSWRDLFVTGLKNAHGVEQQALTLMDRQIERADSFPEVADMLRFHRVETEEQITRLEGLLADFGESPSGLKDAALKMSGNLAAFGHAFAQDEVLKNAFANFAFENFEIASYRSLITLADLGTYSVALDPLNQSLQEEERMAATVEQSLPRLTEKFLALKQAGTPASR